MKKIIKIVALCLIIFAVLSGIAFFGVLKICRDTCNDVDKRAAEQVQKINDYDNTGVGEFYSK